MATKWVKAIAVVCFFSNLAWAEDAAQGQGSADAVKNDAGKSEITMKKDDWLKQLKAALPTVICKNFMDEPVLKQRFDELHISMEQCTTLIPASIDKCQQQYYADLPDLINMDLASKWGGTLGECIGKDFAEKYLVGKNDQSESGKQ